MIEGSFKRVCTAGVLTALVAGFPSAEALATGDLRDLTTNLRSCHIELSISSQDETLAAAVPSTTARITTSTSQYCDNVAGSANPSHATSANTDEYAVDAAPRTVMTQRCTSNPALTNQCYTTQSYSPGLRGFRYEADASYVIWLPSGETFTSTPSGCVLSALSGRTAVCTLSASVMTSGLMGGLPPL